MERSSFVRVRAEDINYVMDTFPIVKRKDEAEFGDYRTNG